MINESIKALILEWSPPGHNSWLVCSSVLEIASSFASFNQDRLDYATLTPDLSDLISCRVISG